MPPMNFYACNECKLSFPFGWGGYMYVEDDSGNRICCPHPREYSSAKNVLGVSFDVLEFTCFNSGRGYNHNGRWWWSKRKKEAYAQKKKLLEFVASKTGYNSYCICGDCFSQFKLDLGDEKSEWREYYGFNREKDKRECPECKSNNVRTVFELIDKTCPKCKKGIIKEIKTGIEC